MSIKKKINIKNLEKIANDIRRHIITIISRADVSHSGSALSAVEIITALYFQSMKINPKKPNWSDRDRFILSKGHAGALLYSTLAKRGFFPESFLKKFCADKSSMTTHPIFSKISGIPGVEATAGSLGHGLAMGIGMALAAKRDKKKYNIYVMLSDGECDEGSAWEGFLFAGFHKIDNLIVFIDYNKIQAFGRTSEVLDLHPLKEKLESFRWHVQEVDGHNFEQIIKAIEIAKKYPSRPHCIIAHTIKGKGISYMEDKLEWHYRSPKGEFLEKALKELDEKYK